MALLRNDGTAFPPDGFHASSRISIYVGAELGDPASSPAGHSRRESEVPDGSKERGLASGVRAPGECGRCNRQTAPGKAALCFGVSGGEIVWPRALGVYAEVAWHNGLRAW